MYWLKTLKNRLSRFLESFYFLRGFTAWVRRIQKKRHSQAVVNYAHLSKEVFEIISSLGLNIFPFYGTLLFLVREQAITFADDFDFATLDTIDVDYLVSSLAKKGIHPKGILQDSFGKVYEITFDYKGCGIDIVFIKNEGDKFVHEQVNFRNEIAKATYTKNSVSKIYSQVYRLDLPKFSLSYSALLNVMIPNESESILSIIYGEDWRIPKTSNFIDYEKYSFIDREVTVTYGSVDNLLPKLLND